MRKKFYRWLMVLLGISLPLLAQVKTEKLDFSRPPKIGKDLQQASSKHVSLPNYNVLFYESFEGDFPPTGWQRLSYGSSNNQWTSTTRKARSGDRSAVVYFSSQGETMNEWLITPGIHLGNTVAAKLAFWEAGDWWENYGVAHYVKISTTSQTDTNSFQTLMEMTPDNHTLNGFSGLPVEIDLSAYMGQTVYFAFVYVGTYADDWYIDDVTIREPQAHDVAIYDFNMNSHYPANTSVTPNCSVSNTGLNTESFPVALGYFDWNGNPVILDTKNVSNLSPGNSQTVYFTSFVPDTNSEYEYFAATGLANDMDTSNDTMAIYSNTFTNELEKVLVEIATGTWCGFCPGSALAIDSLFKLYPDQLAVLEYHRYDDYENTSSTERIDYYKIIGYPTAIFMGTDWVIGGTTADGNWQQVFQRYHTAFQNHLQDKSGFDVDLNVIETKSSDMDAEGQFTANITVTYKGKSYLKDYRLFLALNESHIAEAWKDLDSLHFVAREFYPNADGIAIYEGAAAPTYGMTLNFTQQFTIPPEYVKENCELIAFIQNLKEKRVDAVDKVDLGNLQSCLRGDVNMDNDITPGDALCAFQIYLNGGQLPSGDCNNSCALETADVNCTPNGVTPGDALSIFLAYLQGVDPPMDCVPAYQNISESLTLRLLPKENANSDLISFKIELNNPQNLQAIGADLGYPQDLLEFISVEAADLSESWEMFSGNEILDGVIRIGGYNSEVTQEEGSGIIAVINFRKKDHARGSGELFFFNLTDDISTAKTTPFEYSTYSTNVENSNKKGIPQTFDLLPNYPNPFNMETKIRYQVPEEAEITIQIINLNGQVIRTLVMSEQMPGTHTLVWDGADDKGQEVSSGLYWCRMRAKEFTKSIKLLLLK